MDGKIKMGENGKATIEPDIPASVVMPEGIAPDPDKPETIPPNLFGMGVKRLEVFGEREGFVRRWFNEDGDNISLALKSGWAMVERADIQLNAAVTPRNNDLGSQVRQWVGADQRGAPMYAYLMEKPEWMVKLHNEGKGSREDYHSAIEAQIQSGTLGENPAEHRYNATSNPWAPGSPTGLAPIRSSSKIVR